jgi:CMP-N-acetylneuraminic acid synthetase
VSTEGPVLGLIPARGGSRRAPGKNLARLEGRTLVRRALDTALASGALDRIVLSSDDEQILAEAHDLTEVVALHRPAELATDRALAYDVAVHALAEIEARGEGPFAILVILQATTPFTAPQDVRGTVELLRRTGAPSAVTVKRIDDLVHPLKLKRMEGDRLIPFIADDALTPSHDLPELWTRNGAVYASRRSVIDAGILVDPGARGYPMPEERSLDINTPLDLAFAEFLVSRGRT